MQNGLNVLLCQRLARFNVKMTYAKEHKKYNMREIEFFCYKNHRPKNHKIRPWSCDRWNVIMLLSLSRIVYPIFSGGDVLFHSSL